MKLVAGVVFSCCEHLHVHVIGEAIIKPLCTQKIELAVAAIDESGNPNVWSLSVQHV